MKEKRFIRGTRIRFGPVLRYQRTVIALLVAVLLTLGYGDGFSPSA